MKIFFNLIIISALMISCSSDRQPTDDLAYIDVRNNYPEKEIFLTDITNVSYLYLNSDNDDYLYSGGIKRITDNTVVVVDNSSGSILLFSKDGAPKSRFNHRGQGPGEYIRVSDNNVFYDETADEVFVFDSRKIQVYSSLGAYKRTFTLPEGTRPQQIIDLDDHSFFYFDISVLNKRYYPAQYDKEESHGEDYFLPFYRISKTDGEMLDYIELPGTGLGLGANYKGNVDGAIYDGSFFIYANFYCAVKCHEGVLLVNAQTDTVFLYREDKSLTPYLYKTPSVNTQNPVEFVSDCIDRGQYQFIIVNIMREGVFPLYYPVKSYMRNKQTGETVRPKLLLPDYQGKEFIIYPFSNDGNSISGDGNIYYDGYCFELDLYELKQAYRENKLSGKLKELVAKLDEDTDNNVFVLVNFK